MVLSILNLVPFVRVFIRKYEEKRRRIADLQNLCIQNRRDQITQRALFELRIYYRDMINLGFSIQYTGLYDHMTEVEKQAFYNEMYSVTLKTCQTVKRILTEELDQIPNYYRGVSDEEWLRRDLKAVYIC